MKYILLLSYSILFVIGMGIAQFVQYWNSIEDIRESSLNQYSKDTKNVIKVQEFNNLCIKRIIKPKERINKPISIYECARKNGFEDIADILEKGDEKLKTISFPLSLIKKD